jgi:hypothetical protein
MKKKLNEAGITNELRGASLFFPPASPSDDGETLEPKPRRRSVSRKKVAPVDTAVAEQEAAPAEQNETDGLVMPVAIVSPPETTSAELDYDQLVEGIRKAVKRLGKEATFCRFTQEEKNILGDIVYTYKRNGIRTSENEIIRIAVNWLIENYRADGRNSVLAQVLDKLNA